MEDLVKIFKREQKRVKNGPTSYLREIKTAGDPASIASAIKSLRKNKHPYFEVVDTHKNTKTAYSIGLSGQNYEVKTSFIKG
ncbi:hypothetical protein HCG49_16965 [Arenibacter sp. 6A1]|uniref:hypothetical protein n=1 Tax=Arenibacter sp. 6A1 TaxID=2720391 RepID=UPI00144528E0|nr:hypothetical protein [Arenibacter sp. 6A1]NKI28247.1 hypothetical protein [Arenibacter sp. 6A1]